MGRPNEPHDPDQQWAPAFPSEPASSADAGTTEHLTPPQATAAEQPEQQFQVPAPHHTEQPAYGQDPEGKPHYQRQDQGQPAYSQQQYSQQQYAQQPPPNPQHPYPPHQYGQQQYAQPPYGQPPYVQSPYGQAPPQSYGQQNYQQPQAHLGQPAGPTPGTPSQDRQSGSKKLWIGIVGGVIAALVIAALVIWWLIPTYLTTTVLDQEAIQNGVMGVLVDSDVNPSEVSCPSGVKVEVGNTFTCDAVIGGSTKSVVSTITSDNGNYDVALPTGS